MKLLIALFLACCAVLASSASSDETIRSLKASVARLQAEDAVPQNFVYLQLPREKEPRELWPKFVWTDMSRYYAGLFFRVVGGSAGSPSEVQQGSIPYISSIKHWNAYPYDKMHSEISMDYNTEESQVVLSAAKFRNYGTIWSDGISFNWTTGEVRPRNMAYKVWVRM